MRIPVKQIRYIPVKPEVIERIQQCKDEDLCYACMEPFVGDERRVRRTHERCYKAIYRAVQRGEGDWDDFVEQGLVEGEEADGKPSRHPALRDFKPTRRGA